MMCSCSNADFKVRFDVVELISDFTKLATNKTRAKGRKIKGEIRGLGGQAAVLVAAATNARQSCSVVAVAVSNREACQNL